MYCRDVASQRLKGKTDENSNLKDKNKRRRNAASLQMVLNI